MSATGATPVSKRELFAALAMQGELAASAGGNTPHPDVVAGFAVRCADALIAALQPPVTPAPMSHAEEGAEASRRG